MEDLHDLRWVHSDSVGVEVLPLDTIAERRLTLTNGAGIYSRPMAEWVILALLAAAKRLPDFVRQSDEAFWRLGDDLQELEGKTALLLGLGSVNALVARMLEAFCCNVIAVTGHRRGGSIAGVTRTVLTTEWREELGHADFVVLGLPLTAATAQMIDEDALARMKPTAWLVNVARGGLIDEEALVSALDRGAIGGAVLDAFVEEPLPREHPLWKRSNVVIVPHFTWSSPHIRSRGLDLLLEQLSAWVAGEPLRNVVDLDAGY